jgi:predicted transcriptional regulator
MLCPVRSGRLIAVCSLHVQNAKAKLDQMARDTGRPRDELLEEAVAGLFDELAYAREMLDRRYNELESGRVQPIEGDEAYRRLIEKTAAQRRRREIQ